MKYALGGSILVLLLIAVYFMRGPAPQPQSAVQEEIRFGFIKEVLTDERYRIVFDEAKWLVDKPAEDAAIAAGICTEATRSECLPNDYFITNDETTTIELSFADETVIAMATLNMESEGVKETQISREEFAKLLNDPAAHWKELPYQMLVKDGAITILEEAYVP